MTRTEAMARGKRIFGAEFLYRVGEKLSSADDRESIRQQRRELVAEREAIDAEVKERLAQLDWYVALQKRRSDIFHALRYAEGRSSYFKFQVGKREMGAFWIKGQGDTWEDAFADAEKSKP
jgi:hypothetical protein